MKLLGKAHDAAFWTSVREKECYRPQLDELHAMWDEYGDAVPIPTLRYRDFMLFWETGDRTTFETPYFDRRRMLESTALLALVYPEDKRYLDRLCDVLFAVCDEYSWCLPAHQVPLNLNGVISYAAPDLAASLTVDLFAAETAVMLAEIHTLLGERLPSLIRERIAYEIERRVFTPFTSKQPCNHWEGGGNNWASVCMGSIACAMMLLCPDRARALIPRFNATMEAYLSGLMPDGVCTEGVTYWYYGFGYFLLYADMVKTFTDGAANFFDHPKVKATITFPQSMLLSERAAVSFADAGREATYHLGIFHYLKSLFPDAIKVYPPALAHFRSPNPNVTLRLWSFIHLDEDIYNHPEPDSLFSVYYASSAQWLVKRTATYGFAAKAGSNHELHNHNDVGSFIFAKNGRQVLSDLGPAVYTRQYFTSDKRYESFEACSRGHSVPVVGGTYQVPGGSTEARDVFFDGRRFSMNIAPAYRAEGLNRLDRVFTLSDEAVVLTDRYDYTGTGKLTERLISLVAPQATAPGVLTLDDVTVTYDASVCTLSIRTEPLSRGGECYVIDLTLNDGVRELTCTIT